MERNETFMNFGSIRNVCSASSSLNVASTSENKFYQDTQHRHRKSPRKRLRGTRTSALVIDQLKSSFQYAGDFAPHMRTRRNWRPEFLIRYLGDNRRRDNEEYATVQCGKSCRSFAPDTPRTYSIGLYFGVKSINNIDNFLNSCSTIRSLKRLVRRLMVVCKHWVAQSTTAISSTTVSLKERASQQTEVIDSTKLANVSKLDQSQKISCHSHQTYEDIEEENSDDVSSTLQNNCVVDDYFPTLYFNHYIVKKYCKHCGSRLRWLTKKDAQVQTSDKKDAQVQTSCTRTSRRKKTTRKLKSMNEEILRRDEPTSRSSIADFRPDFLDDSSKANRNEELRLSIRSLENNRAEYINKFTAVQRQIEEITATLRETCDSEKSLRDNSENCGRYFLSTREDANVDAQQNTNPDKIEENEIIGGRLDDRESVEKILDVGNVDDEALVFTGKRYSKDTIISMADLHERSDVDDIFVRDCIRAFTIKQMLHPSNGISTYSHKKAAKCRCVKQISFDLDLTKDDEEETRIFSAEDRSLGEVHLRNFAVTNGDENAKVIIGDFVDLDEPKYHKMTANEEMGEIAVLNGIKNRIDRDFDDLSTKNENDTEDFLTVSQKNINLDCDSQLYRSAATEDTTSATIVESPLNPDSIETQIRESIWVDTMCELSNRHSTFSLYHSCTQFPSFVSLRENQDEPEAEDQSVIDDDSYSNSHSNVDHSRVSSNEHSQSSLNLDRSHDMQVIARHDTSANKSLSETVNESNDACDMFESREVTNKVYNCGYIFDDSNEEEKKSRVHPRQQYTADTTFETSKSSRYIGSIDSGVFVNSSLIDLQPHESSFDDSKPKHKRKQRRVTKRVLHGSSRTFDFSSDSSSCCTDDTLDRRINDVIRDLTKNLVLCERKVRMKLREMRKTGLRTRETRYSQHSPPRACKFNDSLYDAHCDFFKSPRRSNEDERISAVSTPSFMSLPESEIEDRGSVCEL
ncbi:hypothetical protein EAI_13861 [Harpegnathos saltator]|uniref:Uncharacterized protein n=1 Tax=Harpegnathos saltator TaxID=610380 RepID=E2BUE5_HARSA|nr:hypothetical protein EAI_13861 [Harpegnathos saltator]